MSNDLKFQWLKDDLESMKTEIKADIKEVREDVKALNYFKWKAIGLSMGISFIITVAFQVFATFYK